MQLIRKQSKSNRRNSSHQLRFKNSDGVTLIELIITLTLIAILSGVIGFMVASAFRTIDHAQRRKVISIDGTHAAEIFRRDMNVLKDANSLIFAGSQRIQFTTSTNQTIEYQIANGYLYRRFVGQGSAHVLAKSVNLGNSGFEYYDMTNSALNDVPLSVQDRQNVWMVNLFIQMVNINDVILFNATVFPKNHHINHNPEV